jgi:outer membrane protein OmpA-like peptidoglycan-associated protein
MKIKQLAIAVAATLFSGPLLAQAPAAPATPGVMQGNVGMAAEADVAPEKRTADQWVARMSDFTKNASAFKDPVVFAHWMNAMTDPAMVAAIGDAALEPGYWLHSMTTMMQPTAVSNYAQFMIDPEIYARWGAAMLNPGWYTKLITDMTNPRKLMGWMMLPLDQRLMATSMKLMDPNLYLRFMMMPTDPRGMALMFAPMNPQLYGSMMGGLVNPQLVGGPASTWGTFMYPKQPVVSLQPRAPLELPINLLDPSTYGNVLNIIPGMPSLPSLPGLNGAPAGATSAQGAAALPFPLNLIPGVPGAGQPAAGLSLPTLGGGTNPYLAAVAQPAAAQPVSAQRAAAQPAAFAIQAGAPSSLSLGADTLFKSGGSSVNDLTREGRAKLDDLVAKIKAHGAIDSIKVVGHADKRGKPAANQKLSLARAKAVAAYLKSKGVKARTIATAGMGDTKPVVECDMKLAKAALATCLAPNRRVEIEVTGAKK